MLRLHPPLTPARDVEVPRRPLPTGSFLGPSRRQPPVGPRPLPPGPAPGGGDLGSCGPGAERSAAAARSAVHSCSPRSRARRGPRARRRRRAGGAGAAVLSSRLEDRCAQASGCADQSSGEALGKGKTAARRCQRRSPAPPVPWEPSASPAPSRACPASFCPSCTPSWRACCSTWRPST